MARKQSAEGKIENRNALGRRRKDAMFPVAPPRSGLPSDYAAILSDLKQRIQQARLRTVMAANSAMVLLYWDIGRTILARQDRAGWGAKVIDRLSADLREAFPDMKGLSPRNLKYMRAFAAAWPDRAIVQEALAQITWYHNKPSIGLLLCKEKNKITVEYALRDLKKPIGVAEWRTRLVETLPKRLKGQLPSIKQIEKELGNT